LFVSALLDAGLTNKNASALSLGAGVEYRIGMFRTYLTNHLAQPVQQHQG